MPTTAPTEAYHASPVSENPFPADTSTDSPTAAVTAAPTAASAPTPPPPTPEPTADTDDAAVEQYIDDANTHTMPTTAPTEAYHASPVSENPFPADTSTDSPTAAVTAAPSAPPTPLPTP